MEPVTKDDLDKALAKAIGDLRVEWRNEIVAQTRWLATLFIAQFFGTLAAVWFMLSQMIKITP